MYIFFDANYVVLLRSEYSIVEALEKDKIQCALPGFKQNGVSDPLMLQKIIRTEIKKSIG